jgi:aquaporin Z
MVFALGHISGANFNPAVSLAIFLRGKLPWVTALAYVVSQMVGGFLAAFIQKLVIEDWCKDANDVIILDRSCISGYPSPDANVSWLTAFYIELLFTLALALVVLNTATSKGTGSNSFYGLAIGLTVTFGAIAGGSISGGAYNPAVGLALPLIHGVTEDAGLYFLGPLVGGALAALIFRMTTSEADFTEEDETIINGVVLDPLFAKLLEKMDAQQVQLERADAKISPIDTTIKL